MTGIISPAGQVVSLVDEQGEQIPATDAYQFAWQAFYRKTEIFKVERYSFQKKIDFITLPQSLLSKA